MAEGKPEPKGEGLIKKNKKDRTEGKKGDGLETRSLAPEDRPPSQDDETRFVVTSPVMYRDDSLMQYREESDAAENFTILQPPSKPEEQPDDDQTRLIREDEDRTVIVGDENVDATILAANKTASTYVALDEGVSGRSQRGTTEAGRLLKNRFVLEEMIGSGGMGDVYKALDLRAQEARERNPYIAIKMLNENFSRHRDAFISLQRELSKTRGIPHENILAVYDFDREGETVFMSMELLDGEPLDDYLKKHTDGLPEEDAWSIIDGYCQGLIRAHGAGIVHSDFKPGNIFYTTDKTAKVFDFGIARAVSSPGDLEGSGDFTVFDA
ncbi:MAG: serine/threonine protein kinase, partial [Gammaproteobacteria bacterium]|nr:serine/threonine protein kinase [Gammaproteobacteria bacterium]